MQLIQRITLCLVLTCCLPSILIGYDLPTASPEQVGLSAQKLAGTRAALQKLIDKDRIAGGIVVVARRGKIAQFEACGLMDIEDGI
ncbi:MAG: hypothetical protein AMJ65_10530, partial [Phycisphaerae bacterium SG8_4]